MSMKESVGPVRSAPPRRLIRAVLTVALVAAVPVLALALWGGGLAKARWEAPALSGALPFDAPRHTFVEARWPEQADFPSPVADGAPAAADDSVLTLDRWQAATGNGSTPGTGNGKKSVD